jgi:phosphatidylinositol-3-phosphatase
MGANPPGSYRAQCPAPQAARRRSHPNADKPGIQGPGGGRVGAVLLSPFIKPATHSAVAYNQYSLLRSVEDLFGLSHLGDAKQTQVHSFGRDVYTRPQG